MIYYYQSGLAHGSLNNLQLNHYLYGGKEYQDAMLGSTALGLYDFHARYYNPVLGRWFNQDPALQTSNPYLYCGNNPIMFTDPSGQWFGIDDLIVAAFNFVAGYVMHGAMTGDWGGDAFKSGGIAAVQGWLAHNTLGASSAATQSMSAWQYGAYFSLSYVANSFMPSVSVPIGNWNIGMSIGMGYGTGGFGLAANMSVGYSDDGWDFAVGIGHSSNPKVGNYFGAKAGYNGFSYGVTNYFGGIKGRDQWTGTAAYQGKGWSIAVENDSFFRFAKKEGKHREQDRWRTSAVELGIGKFNIGTYVYTNDAQNEGAGHTPGGVSTTGMRHSQKIVEKLGIGAWNNGQVMIAPFYLGYNNGKNSIKIGYSHWIIQEYTQNFIHAYAGPFRTNFFTNYNGMHQRGYSYFGPTNPFTLFY